MTRKSIFTTLDYHPQRTSSLSDLYEAAHQHAKLAEELGYDSLWLAEHHFHNIGSIPNPAVLLGSLARVTQKIRLGPAVAILPFRGATTIAEDYGMVDILSDGRLNMGVGLGNSEGEFNKAKVDFEGRRTIFEERLSTLKSSWNTPYDTSLESLNVRPVQAPYPRFYIATSSADCAYQAGRQGDSVLTIIPPVATDLSGLESVMHAHARGLSESDVDTTNAEVVTTVYSHAAESEAEAFDNAALCLGRFMKAATGNDIPDPLALCRSMVTNNAAFIGTSAQISEQLDQYRELGVEHFSFLCNFGGMTSRQVSQSITCLAEA